MAKEYQLSVVAPDRTVVDQAVQSLIAPGHEGYLGVQAGHQPVIVALKPGLVEYLDPQGKREFVAIGGGFMEVSGDSVIVLADDARRASEINAREVEEALDKARRALRGEDSEMTREEAVQEIERCIARLRLTKLSSH